MSNKQNKSQKQENYHLNSDAVNTLVNADKEEAPRYSEAEMRKYTKKKFHIPNLVWVILCKWWFAGAVCYFVLWGLGVYVSNMIDMLFILGVVLGMVTDLLTNNVIRFIEPLPGSNDKWLLVSKKGIAGFLGNLVCSTVTVVCVVYLYDFINRFVINITGDSDNLFLGVEPIFYGLFCLGFDMLFLGIKRLCLSIWRDAKAAARGADRGQEDSK